MLDNILFYGVIFFFGSCIGSFLNVCIHRIPRNLSVRRPRSMCPACGNTIRFYDNVPMLSFIWLKGRCRFCKASISFRYPLVEMMTGLLAVSIFIRYGPTLLGLSFFVFTCALLTIAFIDIDYQIIPDVITLPGIGLGLAMSAFFPGLRFIESVIGVFSGGGILLIVAILYQIVAKKEGMGGGDIKLLAMVGAMTGWVGVVFTLFVASVSGALTGIPIIFKSRKGLKTALPFGPFLSVGAIAYVHMGPELISWYFRLGR